MWSSGRTFVFLLEFLVSGCLPACLAVKVTAHHYVKYNWSFGILGVCLYIKKAVISINSPESKK